MAVAEIVKYYDPELKRGTLVQHFHRNINPNVKLLNDAVTKGDNPGCHFGRTCYRERQGLESL